MPTGWAKTEQFCSTV